jgi:hypothetical protein
MIPCRARLRPATVFLKPIDGKAPFKIEELNSLRRGMHLCPQMTKSNIINRVMKIGRL